MNENEQRVAENMSANGTVPAPAYVGKNISLFLCGERFLQWQEVG